jgi:hypothetical protein
MKVVFYVAGEKDEEQLGASRDYESAKWTRRTGLNDKRGTGGGKFIKAAVKAQQAEPVNGCLRGSGGRQGWGC